MGSKVSKPVAAPTATTAGTGLTSLAPATSTNTGAGTGLISLAKPVSSLASPAALETVQEVNTAEQIQRGSRIRVLKDSRTRARMRRNRNHRSHRRQRNRHGSRSRSRK